MSNPANVPDSVLWSPIGGPGSETAVVEAFAAWIAEQGWERTKRPSHGDHPAVDARHPDGRRLVAEAKGFSRDASADLDTGYGRLLRRMKDEPAGGPATVPATRYALVVAGTVVRFAQRVPSEIRDRLGITLYKVDATGKVELVDGTPL